MKKGKRLDLYLAEADLSQSREKAKREIIAGWVRVNGETVRVPSTMVTGGEDIVVERPGGIFVSRGGEKLQYALEFFGISVQGRVAADLGASTGGFTHCLLVNGASRVYAIDVGYGQLDYSLRINPAVTVLERTHVRSLLREQFDPPADFLTADLSFISLTKVAGTLVDVFAPIEGLLLIKPQFEALPGEHKKGVVKKKEVHARILRRVVPALGELGILCMGLCPSPLKGPAGNIEFFIRFTTDTGSPLLVDEARLGDLVDKTVERAHSLHETED